MLSAFSKDGPDKIVSLGCRIVYSLSRHLCCELLPFGVVVTAQTVCEDGEVRAHDVHKTFTIVGANGALACFDSSVGWGS